MDDFILSSFHTGLFGIPEGDALSTDEFLYPSDNSYYVELGKENSHENHQ